MTVCLYCIFTSCTFYDYIDLGHHYALMDRTIIKITEENSHGLYYDIIVRPQVLNYDDDDKYIVAYQVYDGNVFYYDSCQIAEQKDSLLRQFKKLKKIKYCYWIIDKETGKVLGPMRETKYNQKCKALGVKAQMWRINEGNLWSP